MNRKDALDAAARCILTDRNRDYGEPEDSFRPAASMMSAYLRSRGLISKDLEPFDVAALMACLKLSRLAGNPSKADSWVDLAGYAAIGAELASPADPPPNVHVIRE